MKFSLVVATMGRTIEIAELFESLSQQTYKNFEVILVDQNEDNVLNEIVKKYEGLFKCIHLKSSPGLSKSRNVGLKRISGEIVAFPDDDCKYPPYILETIYIEFKQNKSVDGLTGRSVDSSLQTTNGNFPDVPGILNQYTVWNQGISYTIFLKREVVNKVGNFDENLGVGAQTIWGSGEETDYLIRAVHNSFKIKYNPNILIVHPAATDPYNKIMHEKTYKYATGMGYVLKKHHYPLWFILKNTFRPLTGFIIYSLKLDKKRALHSLNVFKGRVRGLLTYSH